MPHRVEYGKFKTSPGTPHSAACHHFHVKELIHIQTFEKAFARQNKIIVHILSNDLYRLFHLYGKLPVTRRLYDKIECVDLITVYGNAPYS